MESGRLVHQSKEEVGSEHGYTQSLWPWWEGHLEVLQKGTSLTAEERGAIMD